MNFSQKGICQVLLVFSLCAGFSVYSQNPPGYRNQVQHVLNQLKGYQYADSRIWSVEYDQLFKQAYEDPENQIILEDELIKFLQEEATSNAKNLVLYSMGTIVTNNAEATLFGLLSNEETFDASLYVMSYVDDKKIDLKLVRKLKKSQGALALAIINTLGDRANPVVVSKLAKRLKKHVPPIIPTLDALGNIPTIESANVLLSAYRSLSGEEKWAAADNLIQDYSALSVESDFSFPDHFAMIYDLNLPLPILMQLLNGCVDHGFDPIDYLEEIFNTGQGALIEASMRVVAKLNSNPPESFIESGFEKLSQPYKSQFLMALSNRRDIRIKPYALGALDSEEEAYQLAGLKSLLLLGGEEDVDRVAQVAASSSGNVREVARYCLYSWKGTGVDENIVQLISKEEGGVKAELILSTGPRQLKSSASLLVEAIDDNDRKVKVAALKMLAEIGDAEMIPKLLSHLDDLDSRQVQSEFIKTVSILANQSIKKDIPAEMVLTALRGKTDPNQISILIQVLGNIGNEAAYLQIKKLLGDTNEDIRIAAIKSFSGWPNDKPLQDFQEIFRKTDDLKMHSLSLIGMENLISRSKSYTNDEKANALIELLNGSLTIDERKIVLSGLGKTGSLITFGAAIKLLSSQMLQFEAEAAIIENFKNLDQDVNSELIQEYLHQAYTRSTNEDFKNKITEWLQK